MTRTIEGTMIDTETLSLGPKALIWEVAAVPFRITLFEDDAHWETTDSPYHGQVDYRKLSTRGYDIDLQTIRWTERQRRDDPSWSRWKALFLDVDDRKSSEIRAGVALFEPKFLLGNLDRITGDRPVWFRNAAFDVPAIEHLAAMTGEKMPWHRRQQSDLYTQVNMAQQLLGYEDGLPTVAKHNALDDAMKQVGQLCDLTAMLGNALRAPAAEDAPFEAPEV